MQINLSPGTPSSNSAVPEDPRQADPGVVKVMQAIKNVETSGHADPYNAVGDKGDSHGAFQFNKDNYKNWSKQYGLNPDDFSPAAQNKVAYARMKDLKDQGHDPEEIAAIWNGAHVDPTTKKYTYNNPDYGVKFRNALLGGQQTASAATAVTPPITAPVASTELPAQNSFVTPPEQQTPDTGGIDTAQASTGDAAPQSLAQNLLGKAGAVGNFLFPVAGDIGAAMQGKTDKSALQIAGDTALSVLPFVPGLGEWAEGARGAEIAGEGATKFLPGLLSKIAGSSVARNAAIGYGSGVAQNLAQGKNITDSIGPNFNTIGGGLLGGAGALAGKAFGGILNKATGIAENIKPVLSKLSGGVKLYDEYANIATKRAQDIKNPSVLEHAADYTEHAVTQIKKSLSNIGTEVGKLKTAEGAKPLAPVTDVLKKFAQNVEDKFGLKIYVSPTGQSITLEKAPGRMKDILSSSDETRIKRALQQLITLRKSGNVRKASDVLDNLDNLVDYSKKDLLGNSNDPLEGFLKQTRHDLNGVIGESSPALAQAKTRFSELSGALQTIKGAGGNNLQRAELLLKRVFSGDQSAKSREVFDLIKKETGVDLTEHAVLAKHFVDNMGDQSEKSALQKMLEESSKGGGPTIPGLLLSGGKNALNATIADPIKQGRNIVQGKQGLINATLRNKKGVLTKGLLEAGRLVAPK